MSAPPTPPTPPSGSVPPTPGPSTPAPTPAVKVAPKLPLPPKAVNPFVYLGIPQAVFDYRPKMPGRKMSVFLAVTTGLTAAFIYDRRECARLQKEYIDRVKWMSEAPLDSGELARKVKVYGARVPEDGELERSSKWFKRFMRPIFVASGTDYVLKTGTNPGGLGRTLLAEIRGRRITKASSEATADFSTANSPAGNIAAVLEQREAEEERREVEGGIVLLGRTALKEYLWALRKGYGEAIDLKEEARLEGLGLGSNERRKDGRWEREEELMVRELDAEDAKNPAAPFEESLPVGLQGVDSGDDDEAISTSNNLNAPNPLSYAPYRPITPLPTATTTPAAPELPSDPVLLPPPDTLPEQPPVLLVPFTHAFGIQRWPEKLVHLFNKRSDVRLGGEYALAAIVANSRPFTSPTLRTPEGGLQGVLDEQLVAEVRVGEHKDLIHVDGVKTGSPDLDFLHESDETPYHFRRTYRTLPSAHEYSRRTFYKDELAPKLKVARELANGERQPTKAEDKYPPKMESELRKERLDKELRWRRELEGWAVVRSGSGVAWDERWGVGEGSENPFKVYTLPSQGDLEALDARKREWVEHKRRVDEEREEQHRAAFVPAPSDE